jgi:hypothetical protein
VPLHHDDPIGTEHLPSPPRGRLPHHHVPPHHRWLYNAEGIVTSVQAGELLARFAAGIASSGAVELGGEHVTLPDQLRAIVRHEILPLGEFVVKIQLVWNGPHDAGGRSIGELLG